jgi:putative transposase
VRARVEQAAAQLALEWPAWGHRKIWALLQAAGFDASQATVRRALRERALLQPPGAMRERRALARSRKAAFRQPVARRNRVWQTDFSEHETAAGGVWQLGGVVDYVAKLCLACPVTATKTWRDAVCVLETARERATELLGRPLIEDLTDRQTGEIVPIIVVSDNGACYRAHGFARHIAARPEFRHVRTRYRAPETNGVIERWFSRSSTSTCTGTRSTTAPAWPARSTASWTSTTRAARTRRSTSSCRSTATCARRPSRSSPRSRSASAAAARDPSPRPPPAALPEQFSGGRPARQAGDSNHRIPTPRTPA